ncbi:hypothetical protein V22_40480 [Calycomorphotria hydatis]|uniref:Uncharacterized protein n=1 Tax=Calycomorphotria hydatis TaxID=2528027 RepID=A0A517TEH8_9PLAN|nr:hypothetical protein V22_40480 [Calycomorphotria hydatis]
MVENVQTGNISVNLLRSLRLRSKFLKVLLTLLNRVSDIVHESMGGSDPQQLQLLIVISRMTAYAQCESAIVEKLKIAGEKMPFVIGIERTYWFVAGY